MVEPVSTLLLGSAGEALNQIVDRLGLLERLKSKLMKQPDAAHAKLEIVLIEMDKVFAVLSTAIRQYSCLYLHPPDRDLVGFERQKADEIWAGQLEALRYFAAGDHRAPMRKAHGDCKKITWIYQTYLNPWFARVLDRDESEELRALFRELDASDSYMVDAIEATAKWLQEEATATEALVRMKDYAGAQQRMEAVFPLWQPVAVDLHHASDHLWALQRAFMQTSNPL